MVLFRKIFSTDPELLKYFNDKLAQHGICLSVDLVNKRMEADEMEYNVVGLVILRGNQQKDFDLLLIMPRRSHGFRKCIFILAKIDDPEHVWVTAEEARILISLQSLKKSLTDGEFDPDVLAKFEENCEERFPLLDFEVDEKRANKSKRWGVPKGKKKIDEFWKPGCCREGEEESEVDQTLLQIKGEISWVEDNGLNFLLICQVTLLQNSWRIATGESVRAKFFPRSTVMSMVANREVSNFAKSVIEQLLAINLFAKRAKTLQTNEAPLIDLDRYFQEQEEYDEEGDQDEVLQEP